MTNSIRALRLALVAAGLTVAAPSFASVVTPLCGGENDKHDEKTKSENKKEKEQPKKPSNPA
jgi:hypothetical protein